MVTTAQMYWLLMLDNIRALIGIVCIISFGAACVCCLAHQMNYIIDDTVRVKCKAWGIRLAAMFAVLMMCLTFIPSTRQLATIIIVPKIVNNEKVQTAGNKLYDLAVEWMEDEVVRCKSGANSAK